MNKHYRNQLIMSILFLIISVWTNVFAIQYVNSLPQAVPVSDILYFIPYNHNYSIIAEFLMALAIISAIIYAIKKHKNIPFIITCVALFYTVRAITLPLTPLPTPYTDSISFGLFSSVLPPGGTFPSGHAGLVFMLFFLIDWRDKAWKYFMMAIAITTGFFMIISRGHYTIDVIGSIFITYTIYAVMSKYFKEKQELKDADARI